MGGGAEEGGAQGGQSAASAWRQRLNWLSLMLLWVQAEKSVPGCVHTQFPMGAGDVRRSWRFIRFSGTHFWLPTSAAA